MSCAGVIATGGLPVDALIVEVGEPHGPLVDHVRSATVLVDPGAGVVFGRGDVRDAPVGTAPDDDIAAALSRPLLDPIDVVAVELDLTEADDAGHNRVGRHGRAPGTVWAGLLAR